MAERLQLGDLGQPDEASSHLNLCCGGSDPLLLFALLALHRATGRLQLLQLATRIGTNIVAKRQRDGLFVKPQAIYAPIDGLEPLAPLHLVQALHGGTAQIPTWFGGTGQFHALYDGVARTTDSQLFYQQVALPNLP